MNVIGRNKSNNWYIYIEIVSKLLEIKKWNIKYKISNDRKVLIEKQYTYDKK